MPDTLPDFPVDDATLLAVEHALGACLSYTGRDEDSNPIFENVGSDYSLSQLLDFMSGYDKAKEAPMQDDDGYEIPNMVEYVGGPIYHPHDIIASLIKEVRRLRACS